MRYKKDSNALTNRAFVTAFSENILQNKIIAPIFQISQKSTKYNILFITLRLILCPRNNNYNAGKLNINIPIIRVSLSTTTSSSIFDFEFVSFFSVSIYDICN